ncbi:MAG TPA: amylo-alpha-1,6-glucosidase [Candidatus Bathyarchaeia archaeon]|nr:amylo-alpha-1,6-glucosidase [Candidatus Bathyarchaeia archaeon]
MSETLPKIELDTQRLQSIDEALGLEWLVTNGLGGYASSTALSVNTRKYHGLLVAALNPPVNRHVLLSKLDEEIQIDNETYKLGINEFRDTFYPKPQGMLHEFILNPFPIFKYEAQEVELQKTIFMNKGRNATVIDYEIRNSGENEATVRIFPLINFRHFYNTTHKNQPQWSFSQKPSRQGTVLAFASKEHMLILSATKGAYQANQGIWIENLYYRADASREEDCLDDCLSPGHFELQVSPKKQERFSIVASADYSEEKAQIPPEESTETDLYLQALRTQEELLKAFQTQYPDVNMNDWLRWLILDADSFVVNRDSTHGKSVIAGYHWFEDWGRDTLTSLPGLTLVTGRFDDAKSILATFKKYCAEGVVPNRFSDLEGGRPEYNTVDASLWFFNAVQQYVKYSGDFEFVKNELWNTLQEIIQHYANGTLYDIHMDTDGLIAHGPQLTWMDATVDNTPVTPRNGKAVEIQALWYNALRIMQELANHFNEKALEERYMPMAEQAKKSFVEKFWNPDENCLFDVISGDQRDSSVRPNQILAVSLGYSALDDAKSEAVVKAVQTKLWCECGLRTLSRDDKRYIGKYVGGWAQRNQAYHNGTVWPWLLGPFISAFLKVKKHDSRWRGYALQKFLYPFFQKTALQAGLGHISEIFDGDEPHLPRGCIAQAWSVAEPLRAFVEDIILRHPAFEGKIDL